MFAPVAMRIHPIFTQIKDWTNDNRPDGIEALIEFEDQFGDETKAAERSSSSCTVIASTSLIPAATVSATRGSARSIPRTSSGARWNRTSRTYTFELEYPRADPRKTLRADGEVRDWREPVFR